MRLSEKIDHILRQYNYRRKRNYDSNKSNKGFNVEEYLSQIDSYLNEVLDELDVFDKS